jgi:hypothetical protein
VERRTQKPPNPSGRLLLTVTTKDILFAVAREESVIHSSGLAGVKITLFGKKWEKKQFSREIAFQLTVSFLIRCQSICTD